MPYFGGKSQAGLWQHIVNLIPEHKTFVELFAGSAAITRLKRPSETTILVEKNPVQILALRTALPAARVIQGDGLTMAQYFNDAETVIYADPTYVHATRGDKRYPFELTDPDHVILTGALRASKCKVILSGYRSDLYDAAGFTATPTAPWSCDTRRVMTRGHTWAIEHIWFNFPRPVVLHDSGNVGENFRERWRIEKRRRNWRKHFLAMPPRERGSIFAVLAEVMATPATSAEDGAEVLNAE